MEQSTVTLVVGLAGIASTLIVSGMGLYYTAMSRTAPRRQTLFLKQIETAVEIVHLQSRIRVFDGFVRHWLQEQHFSHDGAVRQRLFQGTGYWPSLLGSLVSGCTGASDFLVRIDQRQAELKSTEHVRHLLVHFGLDRAVIVEVLSPLAILERPMTAKEVEVESGLPPHEVAKWLLWASVLGLVTPVRGQYWQVDPFVGKVLATVSMN